MKNEEKKNLAAMMLKQLKTTRPDLTDEEVCKVGATFYQDALRRKKIVKT